MKPSTLISILSTKDELDIAGQIGLYAEYWPDVTRKYARLKYRIPAAFLVIYSIFRARVRVYKSADVGVDNEVTAFFIASRQQRKALEPVYLRLMEERAPVVILESPHLDTSENILLKPAIIRLRPLEALAVICTAWLRAGAFRRKLAQAVDASKYRGFFSQVYVFLGLFLSVCQRFSINHFVVANDHVVHARSATAVANYLGVETIFIPHGYGGGFNPRLDFSLSLLRNRSQFIAYNNGNALPYEPDRFLCQHRTTVLPRSAPADSEQPTSRLTKALRGDDTDMIAGVGLPLEIDAESIPRVFRWLNLARNTALVVRFHPRTGENTRRLIGAQLVDLGYDFAVSDGTTEEFVHEMDYLVSGYSGLVIDALLARCPVVLANFANIGDEVRDTYGLIAQKLVYFPPEVSPFSLQGLDDFYDAEWATRCSDALCCSANTDLPVQLTQYIKGDLQLAELGDIVSVDAGF